MAPTPHHRATSRGRTSRGWDDAGALVCRAGIMGGVHQGGAIRPGETIVGILPEEPHELLDRV